MDDGQGKARSPHQLGGERGERAGETTSQTLMGPDGLRRLNRYGTAKTLTLRTLDAVGDLNAKNEGMRVDKIRACGDWLLFRHFPTLGETKLKSANFCSTHLVCGFCAIRRGARMMSRYLDRFQLIRAKHPELLPFLVTYTVRNGEDLRERLEHLQRSLTRLHKRRHGKRSTSLLTKIAGAVWSYEVTYSEKHGWHPHVHAIYLAKEPPCQAELRREWEEITIDSFMCDVRPISPDANADPDIDPHAYGFAEVFKYALKSAELPAHCLLESFRVLRKRRLVRSFGHFFGVKEPAGDDLGDELPIDELPYIDLLWRYAGGRYEHAKTIDRTEPSGQRGGDGPRLLREKTEGLSARDFGRADGGPEQDAGAANRALAQALAEGPLGGHADVLRRLRRALPIQASGRPDPQPV